MSMWLRFGRRAALAAALIALCAFFAAPSLAGDFELDASDPSEETVWDPWEKMNRGTFRFNEWLDIHLVEPLAKGWAFIAPERVRKGLRNAFDNTYVPGIMVNALLQGKPVAAAETFGRFLVNTTLGVGGIFDVASHAGVKKHDEDFGQTFGYWGIPSGPYLVLPVFGPSNPRDTVGLIGDRVGTVWGFFAPFWVSFAMGVPDQFNRRSLLIEEIDAERAAAFDWYVAQRNFYMQYREARINDRSDPPRARRGVDLYYIDEDDLYEIDDEDEEVKP